jgi:predicted ABC-type transport system involved in lysophospholipase L1 biosynthesis ATPase subunit
VLAVALSVGYIIHQIVGAGDEAEEEKDQRAVAQQRRPGIRVGDLPLLLDGVARRDASARALDSLDRLGVALRATHFPEQLSGGEMQRVAIARALVTQPATLLCDEPTGNLDSANAADVLAILRELATGDRRTIVLVTHDDSAAAHGDRIVRLRDGRIENEGC